MRPRQGNRCSVSAEAFGDWNKKVDYQPPVYPKTQGQKDRITRVLQRSFLFASLDEHEMKIIVDAMNEKVVAPKTVVITQGDDGDFLFVCEHGQLDCYKRGKDDIERLVKTCESGDTFGELALLYNCPRAASVVARLESVLWQLDRQTFTSIVKDSAARKREKYEQFLQSVPLLFSMDTYERAQLADALKVGINFNEFNRRN